MSILIPPNTLNVSLVNLSSAIPKALEYLKSTYNLIISGHTDAVTCISHSPDVSLIVTGSNDGTVRLWDRLIDSQILFHRHHFDTVNSVFLHHDRFIVSGSSDKSVIVFYIQTSERIILNGHKRMIRQVCVTSNGKFVISTAADRVAKVWDLDSKMLAFNLEDHLAQICSLDAFEGICSTGDFKGVIKVWRVEKGEKICSLFDQQLSNLPSFVNFLKFIDCTRLVGVYSYSKVIIWSIEFQLIERIYNPNIDSKIFAAFPNSLNEEILLFDKIKVLVCSGNSAKVLESFPNDLECVSVSFEKGLILAGHTDRTVKVYDMEGNVTQVMNGHLGYVHILRISPDCKKIASCADDYTVRVWSLSDNKQIQCFGLHKKEIESAAFAKSGKFLVSSDKDSIFFVWKIINKRCVMN